MNTSKVVDTLLITCPYVDCGKSSFVPFPSSVLLCVHCDRSIDLSSVKPTPENSVVPLGSSKEDPRRHAYRWMARNPEAYRLFIHFAFQMVSAGQPFGTGLLRERVRWEGKFNWQGKFKLTNYFVPYICRWLVQDYPELEGKMTFRATEDEK